MGAVRNTGMEPLTLHPIAHIAGDLKTKFGVPRQSSLAPDLLSAIIFEPAWRSPDALRGITRFDWLWLVWVFSENLARPYHATVRPPRLGGNERVGVFATRSPFRPNPIGLSSVRLDHVAWDGSEGPVLWVRGADLVDGTPILDIKPYLPYADSHPDAKAGFTDHVEHRVLEVEFPEELEALVPAGKRQALRQVLAQDPRPAYQHDPLRVYGLAFAGLDVRFRVEGERLIVVQVSGRSPCGGGNNR